MPRVCTICRHEKRNEIEQALLTGEPLRNIAERSGTSATALFRHKKEHIVVTLASAKRASDEVKAETLFERLRHINRETAAILGEARENKSPGVALLAIARVEKQIELEARLLGELSDSVKVAVGINVNNGPSEQVRTLATLLTAEELATISERWRLLSERERGSQDE